MLLQSPQKRKLVISLTPLIDVVFILLIFFMLASNFVGTAEYEISTDEIAAAKQNDTLRVIVIDVQEGGQYRLGDDAIELDALRAKVMQMQADNAAQQLTTIASVRLQPTTILQDGLYAYDIISTTSIPVKLHPLAGTAGNQAAIPTEASP